MGLTIRRLRKLFDVNADAIADGETLVWDDGAQEFVPGSGGGGGGAPSGPAGGVLGGTYPNPSFAADMATQAELDAHVNDSSDAHDASAISILDAANDFTATDVEGALAELQSDAEADATALSDHISDATAAHAASAIANTPAGSIAATTVQAAIDELAGDVGSLPSVYQPLDSDLTAIAALTTTAFGRALLELANQAALLSAAGAAAASHAHAGEDITSGTVADARIASTIARDSEVTSAISALSSVYQPLDSDLTAIAALTTTSFGRSLLALADAAALRTAAGLVIGTNVQAWDADLDTYAGITPTAIAQTILAAANAGAVRTALALVPGTDVQVHDADLATIAGLTPSNDDVLQRKAGAWTNRTVAQLLTDLGLSTDGWTAAGETWTYVSADGPTGVFSVPADVTTKYAVGQRIKLTQTTVKYFIVTAVGSFGSGVTNITVYGGTDYTLANAAITAPYWSMLKAPFGFPLDPAKWTVEVTDTTDRAQASPVDGTWYNLGSITISIPIGCWNVSYSVALSIENSGADTQIEAYCSLSTANNSESDKSMTAMISTGDASASGKKIIAAQTRQRPLTLAAKTPYYLVEMSDLGGTSMDIWNSYSRCVIRAVCAYL